MSEIAKEEGTPIPVATPVSKPQETFPNPMDPPAEPAIPADLEGTPYTSVEDLVNAHKALQAEFTKRNQQTQESQATPAEPESVEGESPEVPSAPEWDWASTSDLYDPEKGWDEKALNHFDSIGLPKEIADDYVRLQGIAHEHFKMQAAQMVGGEEVLQEVLAFVGTNMPEVAPDLNDPKKYQYVLEAAVSRMQREGALGKPQAPQEASPAPQASNQRGETEPMLIPGSPEAVRATADSKMRYDPDYQDRVRAALARGAAYKNR